MTTKIPPDICIEIPNYEEKSLPPIPLPDKALIPFVPKSSTSCLLCVGDRGIKVVPRMSALEVRGVFTPMYSLITLDWRDE